MKVLCHYDQVTALADLGGHPLEAAPSTLHWYFLQAGKVKIIVSWHFFFPSLYRRTDDAEQK